MESELSTLNPNPKDDSPLLKPDPVSNSSYDQNQVGPTLSMEELEKKCAAYVRRDVYGVMGRGELPWAEKLLIALALVTVVPVRVVLATTILVIYYLICKLCTAFSPANREDGQEDYAHLGGWRRNVIVHSGRFSGRAMLFVFGFYWISETYRIEEDINNNTEKLENEAEPKDPSQNCERPGVIISNHVSHLDILYHMSSSFPSFVAKRSVARLPLVGLISKCLGCVYVQRESKSSDFKGVSGIVNDRIKDAHQNKTAPMMMLFPEGTTTNGDYLLPFKTGAFLAKAPVLPVIIRYPYQRFSPAWDSIPGARHVLFLLCQFVNYMEVTKLPIYFPSQQQKDDPKLYAENVRRLMAHEGRLTLSEIGLAEKRIYHAALNGNSIVSVLHPKED